MLKIDKSMRLLPLHTLAWQQQLISLNCLQRAQAEVMVPAGKTGALALPDFFEANFLGVKAKWGSARV